MWFSVVDCRHWMIFIAHRRSHRLLCLCNCYFGAHCDCIRIASHRHNANHVARKYFRSQDRACTRILHISEFQHQELLFWWNDILFLLLLKFYQKKKKTMKIGRQMQWHKILQIRRLKTGKLCPIHYANGLIGPHAHGPLWFLPDSDLIYCMAKFGQFSKSATDVWLVANARSIRKQFNPTGWANAFYSFSLCHCCDVLSIIIQLHLKQLSSSALSFERIPVKNLARFVAWVFFLSVVSSHATILWINMCARARSRIKTIHTWRAVCHALDIACLCACDMRTYFIKWFEFVIRFKFTAKQCYTPFGNVSHRFVRIHCSIRDFFCFASNCLLYFWWPWSLSSFVARLGI